MARAAAVTAGGWRGWRGRAAATGGGEVWCGAARVMVRRHSRSGRPRWGGAQRLVAGADEGEAAGGDWNMLLMLVTQMPTRPKRSDPR